MGWRTVMEKLAQTPRPRKVEAMADAPLTLPPHTHPPRCPGGHPTQAATKPTTVHHLVRPTAFSHQDMCVVSMSPDNQAAPPDISRTETRSPILTWAAHHLCPSSHGTLMA